MGRGSVTPPPQTGQGGFEGVIYSCTKTTTIPPRGMRAKGISGALRGSEQRGRRLCRDTGDQGPARQGPDTLK